MKGNNIFILSQLCEQTVVASIIDNTIVSIIDNGKDSHQTNDHMHEYQKKSSGVIKIYKGPGS